MIEEHDRLLRYAEAAALLNVQISTLYSMVSRQQIPHIRLSGRCVRFSRQALLEWLAQRVVKSQDRVGKAE